MPKKFSFRRRRTLFYGLGTLFGVLVIRIGKQSLDCYSLALPLTPQTENFLVAGQVPLKQRAAKIGLTYGADCGTLHLQSVPELAKIMIRECHILVLGFLKWNILRPTANSWDFSLGDWYTNFGCQHGFLLRGHTLVWHEALPAWFQETVNQKNCLQFLVEHIQKVVGRYRGQIYSWDVVNEVIELDDGCTDGLRNSPWLKLMGADYIEIAFRTAFEVDPTAFLVYNENRLEYETAATEERRKAVLKLLERLKTKGVPIHGFGIQSHLLYGNETRFNPQKIRAFLRDVADLGLKILVTEMDVIDQKLPADVMVRDRLVAAAYQDYLVAVLEEPAVISVITWGLSDAYTWLADFFPRCDGLPTRPLPFDNKFRPKLAWNAIAKSFDHAPHRS